MREVPGFPGYLVTAYGDIYSVRQGFLLKIATRMHKGYLHANIVVEATKQVRKMPVHQMVLFAYHGPKPSPIHVGRHRDGNATRNHWDNVRWGTPAENIADAIGHGTHVSATPGERHIRAKLSDAAVAEIKRLVRGRIEAPVALAARFGVSREHVSAIARGDPRCR